MRKLVFSVVAIAMLATTALFAQDVNRSVSGYLTAVSGEILGPEVSGGDKLWSGNEFEFGATYSQNFASAQWLKFSFTALAVVKQDTVYDGDTPVGQYQDGGSYISGMLAGTSPRAKLALSAAGFGVDGLSFSLAVDTRTLVQLGVGYGLAAGPGRLNIAAGVELYANPLTVNSTDGSEHKPRVLDLIYAQVGYSIPFAEIWSYSTTLYARFNGQAAVYDGDYAPFMNGFELRWDNQVNVNINGLGLWGCVRFDVENLVHDTADVDLDLQLRAGISYSFNI